MQRRDMLKPDTLSQAVGEVAHTLGEVTQAVREAVVHSQSLLRDTPSELCLLRASRPAMATTFEIALPYATPHALAAVEAALTLIETLEDQLTVYRETSELAQVNRLAAYTAVGVEPGLFELLALSAQLWAQTQGAFDISAGPLVKLWGFFRRQARLPSLAEREQVLQRVGMQHVLLEAETRSVRFAKPGLELNLGSIGKGYALDRAGQLLHDEYEVQCALLQGGQSSVLALGTDPREPRGWGVRLQHPWDASRSLATVYLRDRALATSAATFQHLEHLGKKLGHVLDPRTGWPAQGLATVTAFAPTAAQADALSTAFFVLGLEATRAYCTDHPECGAVLLPDDSLGHPVIVNLPVDSIELPS